MFGANSTSERARSWVPGTPIPISVTSGCDFSRILMVLMMESRTLRYPSFGVGIVVLLTNSSSFNTPHAILVAPMSTPIVALILLLRISTFPGRPQHRAATNQGKTQESAAVYQQRFPM